MHILYATLVFVLQYEVSENILLQLSAVRYLYSGCTPPYPSSTNTLSASTTDTHVSHVTVTPDDIVPSPQLQPATKTDFEMFTQKIVKFLSNHLQTLHELLVRNFNHKLFVNFTCSLWNRVNTWRVLISTFPSVPARLLCVCCCTQKWRCGTTH